MVEAVVADEVAVGDDLPGELGSRLDPAAPAGNQVDGIGAAREELDDPGGSPPGRCGRDPDARRRRSGRPGTGLQHGRSSVECARYFSTPLITMPRVKNRWKTRKITIGMIIVRRVPAWMKAWLR